MLTIFSRRELLITFDCNGQTEIRNVLAENGINYSVKTTNMQNANFASSRRGRVGSFGENSAASYEYKIYVHKDDYDRAKRLLGI